MSGEMLCNFLRIEQIGIDCPASADAYGIKGSIRIDTSYIYVCVADNTWVRASIATWS